MLPDGRLVPWRSPGGTPLQHRRRGAGDPVDRPRLRDRAERPHVHPHASRRRGADTHAGRRVQDLVRERRSSPRRSSRSGPGQPIGEPFVPGPADGLPGAAGSRPRGRRGRRWVARADAGEPYTDPAARAIVEQLERYPLGLRHRRRAAAAAAVRRRAASPTTSSRSTRCCGSSNRTRREHPRTPISLLLGDFGHQRASNKTADRDRLLERDPRLVRPPRARARAGAAGAGRDRDDADLPARRRRPRGRSPRPTSTRSPAARCASSSARRRRSSRPAATPAVARAIDPVAGGGDACAQTERRRRARAPPPTACPRPRARGYTLLGAPTVSARLRGHRRAERRAGRRRGSGTSRRAAATQTLVARGLYRPTGRASDVFQLHAERLAVRGRATSPKLELLGADAPYGRPVEPALRDRRGAARAAPAGPRAARLPRGAARRGAGPARPARRSRRACRRGRGGLHQGHTAPPKCRRHPGE